MPTVKDTSPTRTTDTSLRLLPRPLLLPPVQPPSLFIIPALTLTMWTHSMVMFLTTMLTDNPLQAQVRPPSHPQPLLRNKDPDTATTLDTTVTSTLAIIQVIMELTLTMDLSQLKLTPIQI